MIFRYRYGTPFPTEAVVLEVPLETGNPPGFQVQRTAEGGLSLSARLHAGEVLCGLGENVRGINRRGWIFENNPMLGNAHAESRPSRFTVQNALIAVGKNCYGFFVDAPAGITFDLGCTDPEVMCICSEDGNLDFYLFTGDTPVEVVRELRRLIGRSYVPPKWAFGYGQNRWRYHSAEDVRTVADRMKEAGIPLDAIYLDIDYMKDYQDFTVDEDRFPDMPAFAKEMRERGIHLVAIVDSGMIIKEDDPVCREGIEKGYFCKDETGKEFIGAAWTGNVYLPDMLNPEARNWFGRQYQKLMDQGIDGFWNDTNDLSLFYSPEQRKKIMTVFGSPTLSMQLDGDDYFHLLDLCRKMQSADRLYKDIYHNVNGKKVSHRLGHNLYGLHMMRGVARAMQELVPERRVMQLAKISYYGTHRYGGTWTGDNSSWWSHLLLNIHQMVSLNVAGSLYSGGNIGGFNENCTHDLLQRWLEFGVFMPLMRNHSTKTSRRQEPYEFRHSALYARTIALRYSLIPYIYSEFMKAVLEDGMYFRPLVFDYPEDEKAAETEDQLMVGSSIMIAPVYQPNTNSRNVYLPEPMKLLRLRAFDDYDMEDLPQGDRRISCALGEILVFLKQNCLLPMCPPAANIASLDERHLKVFANLRRGEGAEYCLYQDDGETKELNRPEHFHRLYCDAYGWLSADTEELTLEKA